MELCVKVAIRHKRHLPTGFPPFIPFALLTQSSAFCWEVAVNFFFKEKVLFSLHRRSLSRWLQEIVAEAFTGSKFPVSDNTGEKPDEHLLRTPQE